MRYSDSFGEKASKMFLGTSYFGDGITQEDAFSIMDFKVTIVNFTYLSSHAKNIGTIPFEAFIKYLLGSFTD